MLTSVWQAVTTVIRSVPIPMARSLALVEVDSLSIAVETRALILMNVLAVMEDVNTSVLTREAPFRVNVKVVSNFLTMQGPAMILMSALRTMVAVLISVLTQTAFTLVPAKTATFCSPMGARVDVEAYSLKPVAVSRRRDGPIATDKTTSSANGPSNYPTTTPQSSSLSMNLRTVSEGALILNAPVTTYSSLTELVEMLSPLRRCAVVLVTMVTPSLPLSPRHPQLE
jgi:hypothetical protein